MNIVANLRSSIEKIIATANAAPEPEEGEWPKQVVLGHLVDVDIEVWMARIDLMVFCHEKSLPLPEFAWWEPDPDGTVLKYQNRQLDEVATLLLDTREQLIAKFLTLSDDQKFAKAKHATFGTIDINLLLQETLVHDEEHRKSLL